MRRALGDGAKEVEKGGDNVEGGDNVGGGDVMKVGRVHWPVWADGFKRARFV